MKKTTKLRILVVAAHPDDEVLGCGATMAKHVARGDRVRVFIIAQGIMSRKNLAVAKKKKFLDDLFASAQRVARTLGIEKLTLKNFPDNKLDSVPLLDIVHEIEGEIEVFRPNIIYTHHYGDVNVDHRVAAEAVEAAVRPIENISIKKVLAFEIPSSTEWNFMKAEYFRPNIFVGLSEDELGKKVRALEAYASEIRPFPHPRSPEYLVSLAKVRGGQGGMKLAEAFELVYERV